MRRAIFPLFRLFWSRLCRRSKPRQPGRRLALEMLEDRLTPANASSVISGSAAILGGFALPGVTVTLTGTTTNPMPTDISDAHTTTSVSATAVTNSSGHYEFDNVQPGIYTLSYTGLANFAGVPSQGDPNHPGNNVFKSNFTVTGGVNVSNQNIAFGFLTSSALSLNLFYGFPPASGSPIPTAGSGSGAASFRPNSTPTAVLSPVAGATGDVASGSNTITNLSSTANLTMGMAVSGTGIPANATIATIDSADHKITISSNATATATGVSLTFSNPAPVSGTSGQGSSVDLNSYFTDQDIGDSVVQFNVLVNGKAESFDVKLFNTTVPLAVANFLDYVAAGNYNNALFTRLVAGFVLQGGGDSLNTTSSSITSSNLQPVNTLNSTLLPSTGGSTVPSDFTTSHSAGNTNATIGSLAMALPGTDPNGGSKEFFFNLANNAGLDQQSFTVFGQIIPSQLSSFTKMVSQYTAQSVTGTNVGTLSSFPLTTGTTTISSTSNVFEITSVQVVKQPEHLTYSVVGVSDPNKVLTTDTGTITQVTITKGGSGYTSATLTASSISGTSATLASTTGLSTGVTYSVTGTGIPAGTTATLSGSTLTLSQSASSGTNVSLSFTNALISFSGGGGTGATGTAIVTGGVVTGVTITNVGSGYTSSPTVSFTAPGGTGVTAAGNTAASFLPTTGNGYLVMNYNSGVTGTIMVTVQATDEFGATTQSTITVNVAKNFAIPVISNVAVSLNGSVLTASVTPATDSAGNTPTLTYQWFQTSGSTTTPVGTNQSTLDLSTLASVNTGDTFTVQVTPSDGSAVGTPFTSKPATITGTSPFAISTAPAIVSSATLQPGNNGTAATTLTALTVPGSTNGAGINFTYTWMFQRGNGTPIQLSTTGSVLTLSTAATDTVFTSHGINGLATGDKFFVQITPNDGTAGPVYTTNPVSVTVGGSVGSSTYTFTVPTVNSINIQMTGTKLTATPPLPADSQGKTRYLYQWLHDGLVIAGQTAQTLDLTHVANVKANDTFAVRITPIIMGVKGTPVTSKAVTVTGSNGSGTSATFNISVPPASTISVNFPTPSTPQTVTYVQVTDGKGYAPVTLTASSVSGTSATLNSTTGLIDSVTYTVTGTGVPANTTATISGSTVTLSQSATNGTNVSLTFTPQIVVTFSGGGGTGAVGTVVITGNVITGVKITNAGSGYTSAPTVTISGGLSATGDTTVGSNAIANLSSTTNLSVGMTVTGAGIPANTTITSINTANNTITLSNALTAGATGVSLSFGATATAVTSNELLAVPSTTPATGIFFTYQWLVNGNTITGATNSALDISQLPVVNATDVFSVQVTANDGTTSSQQTLASGGQLANGQTVAATPTANVFVKDNNLSNLIVG